MAWDARTPICPMAQVAEHLESKGYGDKKVEPLPPGPLLHRILHPCDNFLSYS